MEPHLLSPPPAWGPPPPEHPDHVRARTVGQASLTMVGIGTALLVGRAVSLHAPPCPFRTITGVPCPGCGMTRLADAVAHGRFHLALTSDAAGVALLVALAVIAVVHVVVLVGHREPPAWLRSRVVPAALVALLATHWVTTLITGGMITPTG